jgi:serine 3-dehydrogenase
MLKDKLVLITGASSGIGAASARQFAAQGARLILSARRADRLDELADRLQQDYNVPVLPMPLDITDHYAVKQSLEELPDNWQAIDILLNNAGLAAGLDKIYEADVQDWETMIDTNIKGLLYMTRYVAPSMAMRNRGHIINIGSIAGHQTYAKGGVYCASKAAVRSITQGLKLDLTGTAVRVTSIDPGMVNTEFSLVRFKGDLRRVDDVYQGMTPLTPDDVADAVLYCATRPPHVNIAEMVLFPTDQSSATVIHRQT